VRLRAREIHSPVDPGALDRDGAAAARRLASWRTLKRISHANPAAHVQRHTSRSAQRKI